MQSDVALTEDGDIKCVLVEHTDSHSALTTSHIWLISDWEKNEIPDMKLIAKGGIKTLKILQQLREGEIHD